MVRPVQEWIVIYSNDNGTNWTSALRVNTDNTTRSPFFQRVAMDQSTGNVGASRYDSRDEPANNALTRFYAAISTDGGTNFSPKIQLESGQSNGPLIGNSPVCQRTPGYNEVDHYDYTGLAFYNGYLHPVWTDNSNSAVGNADGTCGMDIHAAKFHF